MKELLLLNEVARVLGRKAHQVVHALTTGKIPEPTTRIANKRLFTGDDVGRLARHFRVTPNWAALDPVPGDAPAEAVGRLTLRPPFDVISAGKTCCEIKDGDGEVFAWTGDRGRALVMAGLLEAAARG